MNLQIDTTLMNDNHLAEIDAGVCRPEYQSQLSAYVGGISFSPLHIVRQTAVITGIVLMGTIPSSTGPLDVTPQAVELRFVFPDSYNDAVDDEYSRSREDMIASGLPMLSDEELRSEIRERKGIRGEMES